VQEEEMTMKLRLTRWLDGIICAVGCLVSLAVALPWIRRPQGLPVTTVVVAVAIVVISRVPMRLPSQAGTVEITFAPAALVYVSLFTTLSAAALLWLVASILMFITERSKPLADRVFNIGCVSLSGVFLLGIVSLHHGLFEPGTLLLVAAGCAAFFVVDMFLTTLTLAAARGIPMSGVLQLSRIVVPLVCFIGIDTLGYLAALLEHAYPAWAMSLLAVPLLTIVVATRALGRAGESERRTKAIYAIVQAASGVEGGPDIAELLVSTLSDLLPDRVVLTREEAPDDDEIGAPLSATDTNALWLVVGRGRGYDFTAAEHESVRELTKVAVEMIERQQLVGKITHLARFDVLTGLTNRTLFLDRLEHALARTMRGGGSVAVLYCDLDGFKGVNDRLGHDAGDRVLVAVSERLSAQLRTSDTAARLGGDEFAILIEEIEDVGVACELGERIVESLQHPFEIEGQIVRLGMSVGVAFTTYDLGAEELLHGADLAMYSAKTAGKNCVKVFDTEMRHLTRRQLVMEDELRAALEDESLWLAWQPVVEVETGRLDGFEVLLRWTHATLGNIPPDTMLPIATQIGLMPEIGRWVLKEGHRRAVTLSKVAGRPLSLAVNVAAEQLKDRVFLAEVERLAADKRVRLIVELTEHSLIDDEAAGPRLDRLHDAGVGVAIDDFGVGYSSISYLHRFRCIDTVKIDRSFILGLADDDRMRALVQSVNAMAKAFDATVVAEGIEDLETLQEVRAMGCQFGQGYFLGRPEPFPAALDLARRGLASMLTPTAMI
jgi:diguanylate cyclase (GGDEF)-like protein